MRFGDRVRDHLGRRGVVVKASTRSRGQMQRRITVYLEGWGLVEFAGVASATLTKGWDFEEEEGWGSDEPRDTDGTAWRGDGGGS